MTKVKAGYIFSGSFLLVGMFLMRVVKLLLRAA